MAKSEKMTAADILSGGKKEKKPAGKKGGSKKGDRHPYLHTHIDHHPNGSHTVHHKGHDPADDTSYAAADLDGVKAGMDEHLGGGPEAAGDQESAATEQAPTAGLPPTPVAG